ncbi:hypothetical protein ES703_86542 [subsurface metagenome]
MIFTVISILVFVAGLAWFAFRSWEEEPGPCITTILGAIGTFIVVIVLIFHPIMTMAEIEQFNSVKGSLERARLNDQISEFELAAIQQTVIDQNKWLVASQYWAKHPLTNWFWPEEILKLELIK